MKREILSTITKPDELYAIFGFGSFFRNELYRDVDILIVLMASQAYLVPTYDNIRESVQRLSKKSGIIFDITVLTIEEFRERPLREMDSLVTIYERYPTESEIRFR